MLRRRHASLPATRLHHSWWSDGKPQTTPAIWLSVREQSGQSICPICRLYVSVGRSNTNWPIAHGENHHVFLGQDFAMGSRAMPSLRPPLFGQHVETDFRDSRALIPGLRQRLKTYTYTGQSLWSTAVSASDLESNGLAGIDVINWFQSVHAPVGPAIQVC